MAKGVVALVSALFILSVVHIKADEFAVEGEVYCDPCRVKFKTTLATPLAGGKVTLQCRNIESNNVTYEAEGTADANGKYSLKVVGEHEEDICEIVPLSSPSETCNEKIDDTSKIECSKNSGITSDVRYTNPLGFMTKVAEPKCDQLIKEMGLQIVDGEIKGVADDDN